MWKGVAVATWSGARLFATSEQIWSFVRRYPVMQRRVMADVAAGGEGGRLLM